MNQSVDSLFDEEFSPEQQAKIARQRASKAVGEITRTMEYVVLDDARQLLGEDLLGKLLADAVRCKGPLPGTVYPWNVVDFLAEAKLSKD